MYPTAPPAPVRTGRVSPVVGQLYVTCAVLSLAAVFVPLYLAPEGRPSSVTYSLWRGITEYGEGIAVGAVLLILVTAGLLLAAAHRPDGTALPVLVLAATVIGALLIALNPSQPRDTVFGTGLGILMTAVVVAAVTSLLHLVAVTRSR